MARVGRNDPCICGSGLKYKKCCINNHDSLTGSVTFHPSIKKFQKKVRKEHGDAIFRNLDCLPEEEKLSHRILEIANLISSQNQMPVDEELVDIIILVWNFSVARSAGSRDDIGDEIRNHIHQYLGKEGVETFLFLEGLKNQLYPDDFRLVTSHEFLRSGGDIRLNVASMPLVKKVDHHEAFI